MTEAAVSRESSCRAPREPWRPDDLRRLERLVALKIPRPDIADVLGRTPRAVRSKISRLGIGKKYRKPAKWSAP